MRTKLDKTKNNMTLFFYFDKEKKNKRREKNKQVDRSSSAMQLYIHV